MSILNIFYQRTTLRSSKINTFDEFLNITLITRWIESNKATYFDPIDQ